MKRKDWFIVGGGIVALLAYSEYQAGQNRAIGERTLAQLKANAPRRSLFDTFDSKPQAPSMSWYDIYRIEQAVKSGKNGL